MKNIITILVLSVALAFFFYINQTNLPDSISFDGALFEQVDESKDSGMVQATYTLNGKEPRYSLTTVQLFSFTDSEATVEFMQLQIVIPPFLNE